MGLYHAWRKDLPTAYTFHTPLEEYIPQLLKLKILSRPVEKLFKGLETQLLKRFDLVTSNTDEIPRNVEFEKLPVGIDMEFFQETETSFIEDMGLKRPIAGYCGRLSEEKNLDQIIEFFEEIDGTLLIAGEGRDEKRLKEKASENVVFKEFIEREKLPEFYSGLDIFVTGSESDTLSLTTLEASACGTPVLAPDVHPFTETITENGERFQPGNSKDFRSKFEEIESKEYDTRSCVKRFSMEKSLDELVELYEEIL
jgi:glycosyltransferase involved in cell wall biosynthesis